MIMGWFILGEKYEIYPKHAGDKLGKITHKWSNQKWVNVKVRCR